MDTKEGLLDRFARRQERRLHHRISSQTMFPEVCLGRGVGCKSSKRHEVLMASSDLNCGAEIQREVWVYVWTRGCAPPRLRL